MSDPEPPPDDRDRRSEGKDGSARTDASARRDGLVTETERLGDTRAIQDLGIAYGHAVDDRDWNRWQALFTADAQIDYTSAGGIAGTPAELAAWFPGAFAAFEWCMHSMSTHEIDFVDDDHARGRIHVFNRNGVTHEGRPEILDVGAVYEDTYVRVADTWRFSSRIEHTRYIDGGGFADMLKQSLPL